MTNTPLLARAPRVVSAVAIAALLAAVLSACVPAAKSGPDVLTSFAEHGIATVPFAGGKPLHAVTGDTVLVLTNVQVANLQETLPGTHGETEGISAAALDAAVASDPAAASAALDADTAAAVTPSALLFAWWAYAKSSRAHLARKSFPAPASPDAAAIVPLYVMTLFTADALADLGRTDATASPQPKALALGVGGMPQALDPCGTVNGLLASIDEFVASTGYVGTVISAAMGAAGHILDTLTGRALSAVKMAITVINIVMYISTLLTPWKIKWTVTDNLEVGVNGPGQDGVATARLDGLVNPTPPEVSSCFDLFGVVNPTTLKGSPVTWDDWYGVAYGVSPLITLGVSRPNIDKDNQTTQAFTTGTQTVDTSKAIHTATIDPWISLNIERTDVKAMTDWIHTNLGRNSTGLVGAAAAAADLGESIDKIADGIAYALNPYDLRRLVVGLWMTKDEPQSAPDQPGGGAPVIKPLGNCLAPAQVDTLGVAVVKHRTQPLATGKSSTPGCFYDLKSGGTLVIEYPYPVPASPSTDGAFKGMFTDSPSCNEASGYLPAGVQVPGAQAASNIYFVWSGSSLAATYWLGSSQDPQHLLPKLAQLAGLC